MISSIQNFFFPPTQITSSVTPTPFYNPSTSSLSSLKKSDRTHEPKSIDFLTITPQNQQVIQLLLKELATSSVFLLAYNTLSLIKTGTSLSEEVHPYRFLLEILLNPASNKHFRKLYEEKDQIFSGRNQIWNDFARNLGKTFKKEAENIAAYTFSFAASLEADPVKVEYHLQKEDWDGLLTYIITL